MSARFRALFLASLLGFAAACGSMEDDGGPVGAASLGEGGLEAWESRQSALSVAVPVGAKLHAFRATSLRARPSSTSTLKRSLAVGSRMSTINATRPTSGWYNVNYNGVTGWVRGADVVVVGLPVRPIPATEGVAVVYAVPADRAVRAGAADKMRRALYAVQGWTAKKGDGRTFAIQDTAVRIVPLVQTAAELAQDRSGANSPYAFHNNVVDAVFAAVGASYAQPRKVWAIYVDADAPCGAVYGGAAVAGGTGVAVMPANDIRGLLGQATIHACTGAPEPRQSACRWTGGLGHELGHALGVAHPAGCDAGLTSCDGGDLMWMGYTTFPNTYWNAADRAQLALNPLYGVFPVKGPAATCP